MSSADERELLAGLLGDRPGGDHAALRERDGRPHLVLSNEFATVWLRIDLRPGGIRLVVSDPEGHSELGLDPLELEAVSRMDHRDFDERILERAPHKERR